MKFFRERVTPIFSYDVRSEEDESDDEGGSKFKHATSNVDQEFVLDMGKFVSNNDVFQK